MQDRRSYWIENDPYDNLKDAAETMSCMRRFLPPIQKACESLHRQLKGVYRKKVSKTYNRVTLRILLTPTRSQKELFDEQENEQQLRWFQMAIPNRGETVRWNVIATCGGCNEKWPMARHHTRNKKIGVTCEAPLIPFGATISYKDEPRLHQFGTKMLPGTFIHGSCLTCGRRMVR